MLVDKHNIPRIGSTPLQKLTAPQLNAMYADMLKNGRRNGKGGLSVRTVRYAHTVIRKALNDAVGWNLLARNVGGSAQPPKNQKTTKATWSRRPVADIPAARQRRPLVCCAAVGGDDGDAAVRSSGSHGATSTSTTAGTVRRSLISSDYEIKLSEPKTERGGDEPLLSIQRLLDALRDDQGRQLLERAAMAGDWGNDLDLVFTREDGSPIHPQAFSEAFERHVKAAKLPGCRSTDYGTPTRRSRCAPACIRRSSQNASGTRPSRSRSTSTPTPCRHAGNRRGIDRGARPRAVGLQSVSRTAANETSETTKPPCCGGFC